MRLAYLFGFVLIALALAACGEREPAEAPVEAPAETPAPTVDAPVPEPAEPDAAPGASEELTALAPTSPFPDAPLTDEEEELVFPRSPVDDPEALVEEWHALVADHDARMRELRLQALGSALVNHGPEACESLFTLMGDQSADPMTRYLVVLSFEDWIVPSFLPLLEELAAPDQDETTRGFAAYLIGRIGTNEAIPALERLAEAEERRIRLGAQLGLAQLNHEGYREMLLEEFRTGETLPEERMAIAIMFSERADPLLTDFYLEAAADPTLPGQARLYSLQALGQIADPSTKPELQMIADNPELADQRNAAMYAIQMIELEEQGGVEALPPIQ